MTDFQFVVQYYLDQGLPMWRALRMAKRTLIEGDMLEALPAPDKRSEDE